MTESKNIIENYEEVSNLDYNLTHFSKRIGFIKCECKTRYFIKKEKTPYINKFVGFNIILYKTGNVEIFNKINNFYIFIPHYIACMIFNIEKLKEINKC